MSVLVKKGLNPSHRSVSEFGGEAFYQFHGKQCFRGVNPIRKPDFHPSEIVKKVIYR
jgi:hypothetical protein